MTTTAKKTTKSLACSLCLAFAAAIAGHVHLPHGEPRDLMGEAHKVIVGVLRRHRAKYTGGCRAFYSSQEWRQRGERYGEGAALIVAYDGGELPSFFRLGEDAARYQAMRAALEKAGFHAEELTVTTSGIFPIPEKKGAADR